MNLVERSELSSIQQSIRKSISKSALDRWTTLEVSRAYRDLALGWAVIVFVLVAVAQLQAWWMYCLAFLAIGFSQYALFILGHDAIHGCLHPNRLINDRISEWLIHGPMFMGLEDGRRNHLEHHRHLGTASDPDRYLHSLSNKATRVQFLFYCTGLATFGKTVLKVTPFGRLLPQKSVTNSELADCKQNAIGATLASYLKQRLPVLVAQFLLVSFFLVLGLPWWSYLLLWIAPIYLCVFLPDEIRAFCDHAVLQTFDDALADPNRLITFRPSWLEAAIFSPHNMSYHAEHHLFPTVPYYNLPEVHQAIAHSSEITVKSSYIGFLFQVLYSLP